MSHQIDARGLSCPQPVLLTLQAIKQYAQGRLEVLVDNEASRENVGRAAQKEGWTVVSNEATDAGYRLVFEKS